MSVQALGAVFELRGLPAPQKIVLLSLANAYNGHTGKCFPEQARLADECEIGLSTVERHLKWLADHGYIIRKTKRLGYGKGCETHYELLFLDPNWRPVDPSVTPLKSEGSKSYTPHFSELDPSHVRDVNRKPEYNRNTLSKTSFDEEEEEPFLEDDSLPAEPPSEHHLDNSSTELTDKDFERVWSLWPRAGRKRSDAKAKLKPLLLKAVRTCGGVEKLVTAVEAYLADPTSPKVQGGPEINAPGLQVWLRAGRYEHFLAEHASGSDHPQDEAVVLQRRIDGWRRSNSVTWPKDWGPVPSQIRDELILRQRLEEYADTGHWKPEWGHRPKEAA